jgi:adenylosuccinate lyase
MVYPEVMLSNLNKLGGLVHSQQVLLALTQKGASREEAYEMVQTNAMKVWDTDESKRKNVFKILLKNDDNIKKFLNDSEIDKLFNLDQHFMHINTIYERVFESEKE